MRSVKAFSEDVDPALRTEIKAFAGQEAVHGMTIAVQLLGLLAIVGTIRALFYFGIPNPSQIVRDLRFFFGIPGFAWAVIFYKLEYYIPGFHPNDQDDHKLLEKFEKVMTAHGY